MKKKRYEFFFGRFATVNFTVTHAMARRLQHTYRVPTPIVALHDRPAAHFRPLSPDERARFLSSFAPTTAYADAILAGAMRLVVSSTSWTADEDFSMLLDALVAYSAAAAAAATRQAPSSSSSSSSLPRRRQPPLPAILAIITGKGPLRQHYLERIAALEAQGKLGGGSGSGGSGSGSSAGVTVVAAWLPLRDYAALLGAADLGVSLHVSSSGVDLPMKVLDMFGAGLPVVGWCDGGDGGGDGDEGGDGGGDGDEDGDRGRAGDKGAGADGGFASAWGELVKEGVNGRGFRDAAQLGRLLIELLGDGEGRKAGGGRGAAGGRGAEGETQLRRLRQGALAEGRTRWDDVWQPVAGRILGLA